MIVSAAAAAKSLQSCPTLCDPIDGSPPGSPVPGILQARTLEWIAISFSNAWKWKVKGKSLSHVQLLATPWTTAHQAPPSMGFSRQEYWSGVPWPSPWSYQLMLNSIWKNSTLIHYKTLRKLGIEKNLIKIIYKNSQLTLKLMKNNKSFLSKTENKDVCFYCSHSTNC